MGLETPLALLGLLAAGVPLLIHLMKRRDLPTVRLPTIALLVQARVTSRRRLRLVDLLLLLCRAALLGLAAFAIAGPYVHTELAYGDGRQASVVVVLDDSMSATAQVDSDATVLDRQLGRAREAIDALAPGSEVAVVAAGAPARVLQPRTTDLRASLRALAQLPPESVRATDASAAVHLALRELAGSRHSEKRMLVLSDGAAHADWDAAPWPTTGISCDREWLGEPGLPNYAFGEVQAIEDPTVRGQASVRFEVRAYQAPDREFGVRLMAQDTELASTRVTLASGVGRGMLHAPIPASGDVTARLVLGGGDALPADDARGVLLRSDSATRVLVVNGAPRPAGIDDEVGLFLRALDYAPATFGAFSHRVADADTFSGMDLSPFDVVVLANVRTPTARTVGRIRAFVTAGGGLLISGGDQIQPAQYAAAFGDLLGGHLSAVAVFEPPAGLAPVADAAVPGEGLHQVEVSRRVVVTARDSSQTLLKFSDGAPALVTARVGEGRTAFLATTLDDDWSDLPLRPGYLPLVVKTVQHLTRTPPTRDTLIAPGATITLPPAGPTSHLVVVDPSGAENELPFGEEPVPFDDTTVAGAYRVRLVADDGVGTELPRSAFVVAPPASESDLRAQASPADADADVASSVGPRTVIREPFARWLFLVVGLLAVAEAFLRHRAARATAI